MKFSTFVNSGNGSIMYHITPSANVEEIMNKGLIRGVRRSTSGAETQKKIYLTTHYCGVDDIFPNNFGWWEKDMSLLEVDIKGLSSLQEDPEYDNGTFFMLDEDIPRDRIRYKGRIRFEQIGDKFYGEILPDSVKQLYEFIEKRGEKWVVLNHTKTKVLGTHDTEAEAKAQLTAIEISKHSHE